MTPIERLVVPAIYRTSKGQFTDVPIDVCILHCSKVEMFDSARDHSLHVSRYVTYPTLRFLFELGCCTMCVCVCVSLRFAFELKH